MKDDTVVRYTLPLQDHSLEPVVQYQDLDPDTKLAGCLEFHSGHAETGVSIDIDHSFVWSGNLRTNGRRQTEAHGLQKQHRCQLQKTGSFERWKRTPRPPLVTMLLGTFHL